ncbi:beta/gamma crystallin domain-containing protein [Kitasatospora sp. NE20-6]|uniref:beta/gamma crystallin domain-containing protein n=1 Tax=Kitasatospora sp. NE20-6 TaxID=2859066 RepID=UPI0038B37569
MNQTSCTTGDLLHIWGHYTRPLISGPSGPFEFCAANAGTMGLGIGAWVDKISTGNNDIQMNDANGATVRISRWNIVTFPNQPPNIASIQIF